MKQSLYAAIAASFVLGACSDSITSPNLACVSSNALRVPTATFAAAVAPTTYSIVQLGPMIPVGLTDDGTVWGNEGPGAASWKGGTVSRPAGGIQYITAVDGGFLVGSTGPKAYMVGPDGNGVEIPPLAGNTSSGAFGVNANGLVVGSSNAEAFLWTHCDGTKALEGGSEALDINMSGDAVGSAGGHAALWHTSNGTRVDLPFLHEGDGTSRAMAINDQGMVVGWSGLVNHGPWDGRRAFVWTAETGMTEIGTFGGDYSEAFGVNNLGQVVGEATDASNRKWGFVWTREGGIQKLPDAGAGDNMAIAISESGDIAGLTHGGTEGAVWVAAQNKATWGIQ